MLTPDASSPTPPSTVRAVSEEIDLAGADDLEIGFAREGRGLVARSTHAVTMTADGLEVDLGGSPVSLAHAEVTLAGAPVTLGAPSLDARAHATREGGGVLEITENQHDSVAQRWRFATRASGEIVVRVPVPGATLDRDDARGLHLVRGATRFVYSHARLIDARGASSDVRAVLEDGAIVLRVPATLVGLTEFPAVLDPTIGPEIPLFGASQLVRDSAPDSGGMVTVMGSRAVAVWGNGTTIRCGYMDPSDTETLRASRVIATNASTNHRIAVSGGIGIVLFFLNSSSIGFVRFDDTCTVLDPTPRTLLSGTATLRHIVAVPNGFMAAWSTTSTTSIRGIALDGSISWTAPVSFTDADGTMTEQRLVPNANDVLCVYRRGTSIRARRLAFNGVALDTTPTVLDSGATTTTENRIETAAASTTFAAFFRGGSATQTLATFDAATLARLVTAPPESLPPVGAVELPRLAFDGTRYGLAFTTTAERRVHVRTLDPATLEAVGADVVGTSLTPAGEVVDGIAPGNGGFVASAGALVDGDRDPIILRADGSELDPSYVVGLETGPAVGSSGSGFLATWGRLVPTPRIPRAIYVSSTGVLSPAGGFRLGTATIQANGTYFGDVSASPTHYLTQWTDGADNGLLIMPGATSGVAAYPSAVSAQSLITTVVGGQLRTVYRPGAGISYRVAASPTNESGIYPTPTGELTYAAARNIVAYANASGVTVKLPGLFTPSVTIPGAAALVSLAHAPTPDELLLTWATAEGAISVQRVSSTATLLGTASSLRAGTSPIARLTSVWDGTRYVVAYVANGALVAQRVGVAGNVIDGVAGVVAPAASPNVSTDMAADGAGNVMIVYGRDVVVEGVAATRVYGRIVDFSTNGASANGTSCVNAWTCASGACEDGVCCDRACGDGSATCEACSVAAGGAVDGTCTPKMTGIACRGAAGPCDVGEACDGASATCPPDVFKNGTVCGASSGAACDAADVCDGTTAGCPVRYASAGTSCRAPTSGCDAEETCSGLSATCPIDAISGAGVTCRASAGPCDLAETCNGISKLCPNDAFRGSATTCRPIGSVCDRAEQCTGNSALCPADGAAFGTTCRASTAACDATERCDGVHFDCPADGAEPTTTACRPTTGACDETEFCDGVHTTCPTDVFAPSTKVCRPSAGVCDTTDFCDGAHGTCPANAPSESGIVCRPSSAPCDAAEICDGVHTWCPSDAVASYGTLCRDVAGACDLPEFCDGARFGCPTDAFRTEGTVCRAAAGACDIAELCSGTDAACLLDLYRVDGSLCDDGLVCNGTATCLDGACQPSSPLVCEPDEQCNEALGACMPEKPSSGCSVATPAGSRASQDAPLLLALISLVVARRRRR